MSNIKDVELSRKEIKMIINALNYFRMNFRNHTDGEIGNMAERLGIGDMTIGDVGELQNDLVEEL